MTQTIYTVTYYNPKTTIGVQTKTFEEKDMADRFYKALENEKHEVKLTSDQSNLDTKTRDYDKYKFVPVFISKGIIDCIWKKQIHQF